ncbi:MAG TPA: hypothetical protein VL283_04275 [Candidatus Baltobacteraceae bacterium]|nr:hypothetical protein [Candidatus Baltobacteraceae bacterium]
MPTPRAPWTPPSWGRLGIAAGAFFALFLFDAYATTILVDRGAEEAMSLPATMLGCGRDVFVGWKAWLAAFGGLLFLCSSRYQRWCWWVTLAIVFALVALALLHVYFLAFFHPSAAR